MCIFRTVFSAEDTGKMVIKNLVLLKGLNSNQSIATQVSTEVLEQKHP